MKRTLLIALFTLLSISPAAAQKPNDLQQNASRLAGSILVGGHTMDYEKGVSDLGGRLTGSPAYQRAAEWAAAQFKAAGIKNVRLEPFTIPNGWERGWASGKIVSPVERHLVSTGFHKYGDVFWSFSDIAEVQLNAVIVDSDRCE